MLMNSFRLLGKRRNVTMRILSVVYKSRLSPFSLLTYVCENLTSLNLANIFLMLISPNLLARKYFRLYSNQVMYLIGPLE